MAYDLCLVLHCADGQCQSKTRSLR